MTNQPIRFVINTHHHSDHAGGNPVFAQARDDLRAEERARPDSGRATRASKEPLDFDPVKAAPTVTYDGELIFHLGGEEIHLYHPARAHTDGDTIVHFKNANIALWGDAFINNWVPVIDVAGGASSARVAAVHRSRHSARRRERDDGAGARGDRRRRPTCGASGTYFTNMQDNVRKAIAAGKTREQAMDEITVPAYANLPGGAARIRMNVAAMYDELRRLVTD